MNQKSGTITAIVLAFAAIIGYTALPSRNTAPAAGGGEAAETKSPANTELPVAGMEALKLPCREIEKRLIAFLPEAEAKASSDGNAAPDKTKVWAPDNCYEKTGTHDFLSSGGAKLHFVIATLPNPVHTHFSLAFDRIGEALQQAAQDQGYNYDSSWLPWVEHPRQYSGLKDQKDEEARLYFQEKQPGLLVFRKSLQTCSTPATNVAPACNGQPYPEGLLVFVVGENPTGGIDGEQFENAIAWIDALRHGGTSQTLRILSPFFSGSFSSLARLLTTTGQTKDYIKKNKKSIQDAAPNDNVSPNKAAQNLSAVEIFSGSATSAPGIFWFQAFLKQHQLGRFVAFQESDDLLINRYCRLLDQQRYDTGRLAIISEDETAYGAIGANAQVERPVSPDSSDASLYECIQHYGDETRGPLNLYYPRDIAALRSAYGKQSIFGSQGRRIGLAENLSETDTTEHDTIRPYGGDQSPQSQESSLFALVNLLKAHRIEFIVLRSSNGLDQIFMTQFFARTYPDARVVLLNSDLMFRRSTGTPGFRGTMTMDTYPLLTWQQDWTYYQKPESRHSHRTFADANSEGIYLASRFLIHLHDSELGLESQADEHLDLDSPEPGDSHGRPHKFSVLLQDYGPPTWLIKDAPQTGQPPPTARPPTWLSVLGASQVWPIAVIDEDTMPLKPNPPVFERGGGESDSPAGTYHVQTSFFGNGRESQLSDESVIGICQEWPRWFSRWSGCRTIVVKPPTIRPTWAEGYKVYIGKDPGSETLQGSVTGWEDYTQQQPLTTGSHPSANNSPERSALQPAQIGASHQDENLLLLPLSIRVCFSLCFMWCLWHLYCCCSGSQTGAPRYRAYFAPSPGPQHNILIFFGCMLFALLAIAMASLTGVLGAGVSPFMHGERMTILYWLLAFFSLIALVSNYWRTSRGRRTDTRTSEKKAKAAYDDANKVEERIRSEECRQAECHKKERTPEQEEQLRHPNISGSGWTNQLFTTISRYAEKVKKWNKRLRHKFHHRAREAGRWICEHPRKWALLGGFLYLVFILVLRQIFEVQISARLDTTNRIFTYWRAVNLFTGVSPLTPFLLLLLGMYAWFWYTLAGLALFNQDRPLLPSSQELDIRLAMFSRERAAFKIERLAKPLSGGYGILLPGLFLGLVGMFFFFTRSDDFAVRSLGTRSYGFVFFIWLSACVALIVSDGFQILRIWSRLRQLLVYLDRLPLRRTLSALRGFSWGTVWKMSGSVLDERYKLLSRQMESFRHLKNELEHIKDEATAQGTPATGPKYTVTEQGGYATGSVETKAEQAAPTTALAETKAPQGAPAVNVAKATARLPPLQESFYKRLETCEKSAAWFGTWYINSYHDPRVTDLSPVHRHQVELTKTAAAVCNHVLLPMWAAEKHSLIQDLSQPGMENTCADKSKVSGASIPEFQCLAEEFFLLPYLGFIQNVLGRMRTLAFGMLWLFIAAAISVASYPFDPRPVLSGIFLFVFFLVGAIIVAVYAGMHRDSTLSHITDTTPGELGTDFWVKLIGVGAGPLAALLTALFPDMAGFLTSWLQPGVQAIK